MFDLSKSHPTTKDSSEQTKDRSSFSGCTFLVDAYELLVSSGQS